MYQGTNGETTPRFTRTGSQICPSPDEELLEAVLCNNTPKIRQVIVKYEYLLSFTYSEYNKRILLIACSEDGVNAETVNTLLSLKANPRDHNEDDGWEALHLAACKTDYNILDVLLKNNPGDVNVIDKLGSNALHILIRYGNRESPDFLKCAELLVQKGIDVNCEDSKNKTPLYWANKKGVGEEIKKIIEDQNLFRRNIPQQITNNNLEAEEGKILMKYLKQGNEDEFVNFKEGYIEDLVNYSDECNTLLQMCCKRNLAQSAIHLLNKGADVNLTTSKNTSKPIEIAAEHGFPEIFRILLDKYNHVSKIPEGLFGTVLKYIDRERHGNVGCYKILIEKLKGADPDEVSLKLNEKDNDNKNTPLHYAIRYADQSITQELLSLGASLGAKNKHGVMPVEDIEPETLEKHLDRCVVFDLKSKQTEKEDYQVKFNYRSIIPPYAKSNYNAAYSYKDLEAAGINSTVQKELVAETEVIFFMSKASEYKHLLKHPVIVSFLFMKWLRIQWLFWVNLAFYVTFALSLVIYIFTDYAYFATTEKSTIHNIFVQLSYAFLIITLIVLILRELFQICVAPLKYLKNFENYLEILLIVLTAMIVFVSFPSPDTRKQLSSICILLAAFELVLMLGNHPYFSTNVVMLRTVSLNFFKFLMWYSLLIIAFALSFYLLFTNHTNKTQIDGNNTEVSDVTKQNVSSETDDKEDKDFDNPGSSVFKTIVMLTGEFDASDLNFDTFPITSKIIFALFIFMIAIILLNLLNGLAVSDTQMIKNDAELVGHIARAQHIRYVESMLVGNLLPANFLKKVSDICCCLPMRHTWNYSLGQSLAKQASLFPKYLNYELIFFPNKYGLIDLNLINDIKSSSNRKSCTPCSAIYLDRDTVRRTNNIVQATKEEKLNNQERYIRKIEDDLESLKRKMNMIIKLLNPVKEN